MPVIRQQLGRLVGLMVDRSDEVEVAESAEGNRTLFTIKVATTDLGMVIGKQGRTIGALRSLVALRGEQRDERYELEVAED
ncbi:MAG: KH domain-containing protein [Thermoanaerobaculia bacterium]